MGKVIRQIVSFYPDDYRIVKDNADAKSLGFSPSLRVIIREWHEMKMRIAKVENLLYPDGATPSPGVCVEESE